VAAASRRLLEDTLATLLPKARGAFLEEKKVFFKPIQTHKKKIARKSDGK
jgi:hypothetical protein